MARVLSAELHDGDSAAIRKTLQLAVIDREIAYLVVKGIDGSPIAGRWARSVRGEVSEHEFPLRAIHLREAEKADNVLFGAGAGPEHGGVIGTLSIGVDLGPQRSRILALVTRTVLMIAAGAVVALLIGHFLVRRLLKRSVEPLLDGIRGIGSDLSRRVPPGGDVEIAEIAEAFNDMAFRLSNTLVSKEELESVVARRTAELRAALDEQVHLERQLQQSRKLEAIGVLAGGIAHDFNNLLTPIIGYTEMAIQRMDERQGARKDLAVVLDSAVRASGLTRQILAFSRKQLLEMKVLELNGEILSIGKMVRRLIGENIDIRLDLAPGLPCVKADPTQIQQVLLNLAINARDAMPDGGSLTIQSSEVEIDESPVWRKRELPPGRYVQIAVSDTGTGMDESTRIQAFEPFFTTKEQGKGTGLGLSTVYGIVKQHGGDITLYSEPGHGTTFRIYLPSAEGEREPQEEDLPAEPERGSGRILLVEDDEAVRGFAQRALEEHGYEVAAAAGGEEALKAAAASPFDLLVSDVVMPGMNGRELYKEILRIRPGLPVLYVSGYPAGSGSLAELFDGGEPFLQKPFPVAALLEKVRSAMQTPA
jgi:signal transduction histidine kinase/CheY-like chemotaxis protein